MDPELLKTRLQEKEVEMERAENKHNSQMVGLIDEMSKAREKQFTLERDVTAKETKLREAAEIISELRRDIINRDLLRDSAEADEAIRRRARCDRGNQCTLGNSLVMPSTSPLSPTSHGPRTESNFLALAQQERDRCAKFASTTALTQTDPVVVLEICDAESPASPIAIPSLQLGRQITPEAALCLTSRLNTGRDIADPVTAREICEGLLSAEGLQSSARDILTSRVAFGDTLRMEHLEEHPRFQSPEESSQGHREASLALSTALSQRRSSRSPGLALMHMNEEIFTEDPRIEDDEVIQQPEEADPDEPQETEFVMVEEADVRMSRPTFTDMSQQTQEPAVVSSGTNTEGVASSEPFVLSTSVVVAVPSTKPADSGYTTTDASASAIALFRARAFCGADALTDRVTSFLHLVKGELDEDGHFAALFLTGMLASFMFAR